MIVGGAENNGRGWKRNGDKKKKKQNQKQILREMFCFSGGEEISDDDIISLSPPSTPFVPATTDQKFARPKNNSQKQYLRLLNDETKKVVIATGPAGTGKTLFATEYAIRQYLAGKFDKIIITRPSVSVDEDLGFLPGDIEQKMAPWMRPIYDIFYAHFSVKDTAKMVEEKVVEICPLGFMRGRTFKRCCIICDEMQNSTISQMKMLLTRIGEDSRIIITGDLDQSDRSSTVSSNSSKWSVASGSPQSNGLEDFMTRFRVSGARERSNSISSVEFGTNDIEREPVVREILNIYDGEP
jgi:phosphate starvation-inducible PhoH-like protein